MLRSPKTTPLRVAQIVTRSLRVSDTVRLAFLRNSGKRKASRERRNGCAASLIAYRVTARLYLDSECRSILSLLLACIARSITVLQGLAVYTYGSYPCCGLCGTDVLRAPEVQHPVQNVGGDGHVWTTASVQGKN